MKKLTALCACFALLIGLAAGCGSGAEIEYYDEPEEPTAQTEPPVITAEPVTGVNIGLGGEGAAAFAPDTIVGTVNGSEVTWTEYYYWLSFYVNQYLQQAQQAGATLTRWDAAGELSSQYSNAEALAILAQYSVKQYHAVETEAVKDGVALSEEDWEQVEETCRQLADADGDGEVTAEEEEVFDEQLADAGLTRDYLTYYYEIAQLTNVLFASLYGENGAEYPDALAVQYATDAGALYAKHILLLTVDPSTGEALDEDTVAQKRELADTLAAELAAVDDTDALIALFDEYMNDYSEDTGLPYYPDGYLFGEGEMVEAFENATKALDEDYGLSGVVESEYGYHIILRQPITPETVVGTDSATGEDITLRHLAAEADFTARMDAWTNAADAQWTEGFAVPDMARIFG